MFWAFGWYLIFQVLILTPAIVFINHATHAKCSMLPECPACYYSQGSFDDLGGGKDAGNGGKSTFVHGLTPNACKGAIPSNHRRRRLDLLPGRLQRPPLIKKQDVRCGGGWYGQNSRKRLPRSDMSLWSAGANEPTCSHLPSSALMLKKKSWHRSAGSGPIGSNRSTYI